MSLGSTDTLIQHPAGLTHRCMSDAAKASNGISASLLRLSVGLEDPDDLWRDLEQALDAAHPQAAGDAAAPDVGRYGGRAVRR